MKNKIYIKDIFSTYIRTYNICTSNLRKKLILFNMNYFKLNCKNMIFIYYRKNTKGLLSYTGFHVHDSVT